MPSTSEKEMDMSEMAVQRRDGGTTKAALGLGVLSLVLFIGGGFSVGGIFWLLGAVAGLCAIVVGVAARRSDGGRGGIVAIALGAVPAAWFAAYILVEALG
jgi:hypothetical protein